MSLLQSSPRTRKSIHLPKADVFDEASSNTSEAAELELLDYARGRLMIVASGFGKLE
jgi:hypothetical protein